MRCDVLILSCFHVVAKTYGFSIGLLTYKYSTFPNTLHSTKLLTRSEPSLGIQPQ